MNALLQNVLPFPASREDAGESLVTKLRQLRKSLPPSERIFADILREAEIQIRYQSRLTPEDRVLSVIRAVKLNDAHALDEIAEDTGLSMDDTRSIVLELVAQEIFERRERLTIGGSQKQYLYWAREK